MINNTTLDNIWYLRTKNNIKKELKEFHKPDIWFSGKNREFENDISEYVTNAKDIIVLCSFLLEQTKITEELLKIVTKNVRVYILTASENQLDKIYNLESELEDERITEHKNLLKILRKKCLIRTAPHFHAKYILVDPKKDSRLGFLSSANFTQHAFTNNIEIGLSLNSNQIIDLFNLFCYTFWNESKHEYLVESTLRSVNSPPDNFVDKPNLNYVISPHMNIDFEKTLHEIIEKTTGDIYLSTYSIDSENSIYSLLLEELSKKRKVTIFIRPRKNDLGAINELFNKGAKIYGDPHLHFKCLLIGNDINYRGLIFTGNITKESFSESHDVGVFLNPQQYKKILDIIKNWEIQITGVYMGNESINNLSIGTYLIWNPKRYEFQIRSSQIDDLGVYEGEHIDSYKNFKPNLNIPNEFKFNTKEVIFKWINTPPKLPNESKKVYNLPKNLPKKLLTYIKKYDLYQKGSHYYLLYREGDDLKELRKISELTNFRVVVK